MHGTSKPKAQKILYLQYTNPACYPPLEHSSRILANSGWQVLFLGTGAFGGAQMTFPNHINVRVRQFQFCRPGWRQKLHYAAFCIWAYGSILVWKPNWVYASDLPACPVSLLLSSFAGVRLIYHEHDSPVLMSEKRGLFRRLALRARSRLAGRSECCIVPNESRAERFNREIPVARRVLCVFNCPSLEEVRPPRQKPRSTPLVLYYHGNIGPSLVPPTVVQALKETPSEVRLRVVGYETIGNEGYIEYLRAFARELSVEDRVELLPALPRKELLRRCSGGDVGLAIMPIQNPEFNHRFMVGASNKVFDYLACGLAVLVSDVPDWNSMYVEPGYGLSCVPEDADSIAAALRWFLENREETRLMGERGRCRVVSEWNYEAQFEPVLKLLQNSNRDASSTSLRDREQSA
jgi:glycosyltransferase involved in cell wall biosynthesis